MPRLLEDVNQRTQLAGQNRFEMLLFSLGQGHRFGVNVFKVREVIPVPPIRHCDNGHPYIRGLAHIRGRTLPIVDLGRALDLPAAQEGGDGYIIVTEFSRSVQGFLVAGVDRIINLNWEDVLPPPEGHGRTGFLTAVARVEDELLEVLDVERVLAEIGDEGHEVSAAVRDTANGPELQNARVLVVDDSSVARNQIRRALEQVGIQCTFAGDGQAALEQLQSWARGGILEHQAQMVISDIEMPQMDGYTLTWMIRQDADLAGLFVLLHSSLSGGFNQAMVDKVGADQWLSKFSSDELADVVVTTLIGRVRSGSTAAP